MIKQTSIGLSLCVCLVLLLAGCAQGASTVPPTSTPSGSALPQPSDSASNTDPTIRITTTTTLDDTATDSPQGSPTELDNVTIGLDWTPNTNHTGLYVAQNQGYYQKQGLAVEIVQAQEGGTVEQLVASGKLDFGISFQESVTHARVEGIPIVSIAAIIQHNTSGFASRTEAGIKRPADFAGKTYGSFGTDMERAIITELMKCDNADVDTINFVDIGSADFFVATERGDIDIAWIFQGWQGIEAEVRNIPINVVMINDLKCIPDFYTPVIITSEDMVHNHPDVVKRFVQATSSGYEFAIKSPDQAADMLLQAAPELDRNLVQKSQRYLADQYQADAPRWGEQIQARWQDFAQWMVDRGLLPTMIEADKAFTNEFLPEASGN